MAKKEKQEISEKNGRWSILDADRQDRAAFTRGRLLLTWLFSGAGK
jgi:hypothetical protein